MMRSFEYARPESLEQAVALLHDAGTHGVVLAGGTDLLAAMKDGAMAPSRVVSLGSVPGLDTIAKISGGGLRIGARVTIARLLADTHLRAEHPGIVQAAEGILSPQIRNMGTVGGELCQRPRCWYFRHGYGLLARRDGRSMVVDGDNRYHAILGNAGPAYFINPSSLAPVLIALGAELTIIGPGGERRVPVARFYRTPRSESERELDLAPDEIVTAVEVPSAAGRRSATYEVRHRQSLDWPLAAAAAVLEMDGDVVRAGSIVMGHVAPVPWPASKRAEQVLRGKPPIARTAEVAGRFAVEGARALSGNDYKIRLARVAVKRAILRAAGEEV